MFTLNMTISMCQRQTKLKIASNVFLFLGLFVTFYFFKVTFINDQIFAITELSRMIYQTIQNVRVDFQINVRNILDVRCRCQLFLAIIL